MLLIVNGQFTHLQPIFDWIEESPWEKVDGYYSGGSISGTDFKRLRSFYTEGYEVMGGTWDNKWLGEDLS